MRRSRITTRTLGGTGRQTSGAATKNSNRSRSAFAQAFGMKVSRDGASLY